VARRRKGRACIDVKYKALKHGLHLNSDLYQVTAYCVNSDLYQMAAYCGRSGLCEGWLVHACRMPSNHPVKLVGGPSVLQKNLETNGRFSDSLRMLDEIPRGVVFRERLRV
jgi:hypothetical protein